MKKKIVKKRKFLPTSLSGVIYIGVMIAGMVAGVFVSYIVSAAMLDVNEYKFSFTSGIYYIDSDTQKATLYETIQGGENREWADMNEIPDHVQNAAVAIEDERFFEHPGVDVKRLTGAVISAVTGSDTYGASTITQQLVKNLTGNDKRSVKRKIQEMWTALQFERRYSKREILELYLNSIYLSEGCYGIKSAAKVYFNKDVEDLTIAEGASLVGITQLPTYYDPFLNPENNKDKQERVLGKMHELGYITDEEYQAAMAEELKFATENKNYIVRPMSYFSDQVISDVIRDLQEKKKYTKTAATHLVYSGGIRIISTVDPDIQGAMEDVFEDNAYFPGSSGGVKPEAAMTVMEPYSGQVVAMVGGRGVKSGHRVLNRATGTTRAPGSTIKPLSTYGPAIENGTITPASTFIDEPTDFGNGYAPKNWYNGFRGKRTALLALEESGNIIPAKIVQEMGPNESFDFMEDLGFTTLVDKETQSNGDVITDKTLGALALGGLTYGVSTYEMTAAYSAFVNKGVYTAPYTYTRVEDSEGNIILENKKSSEVAMSERTAAIITDMLVSTVRNGLASASQLPGGMPTAGKTGTTDSDVDRWFVGYSPYYVGAVWFGYDTQRTVVTNSSINPALNIWRAVMTKAHEGLDHKNFAQVSGTTYATICTIEGELAGENCSARRVLFKNGTQPKNYCEGHISEEEEEGEGEEAEGEEIDPENPDSTPSGEGTTDAPPAEGSVPPAQTPATPPTSTPASPPADPAIPEIELN